MSELAVLLEKVPHQIMCGTVHKEIHNIVIHSDAVECGDLFVCLKGYRQDGHRYIRQAVQSGATAILVQEWDEIMAYPELTVILVSDTRAALANIAHVFYGYPARKLLTVGITGTKGKTTTAWMAVQILRIAGMRVGYIGTLGTDCGNGLCEGDNTTPESLLIAEAMAEMVKNRCQVAVVEASSQGLKMHRLDGIRFDIGVYLNLAGDHIGPGEHQDMKEYASCKAMLLRQSMIGICNAQDPYTEYMVRSSTCREITYFSTDSDRQQDYAAQTQTAKRELVRATKCRKIRREHTLGMQFLIPEYDHEPFEIPIPGIFNVENALAAAVICRKLGVGAACIRKGLRHSVIPGRMENISIRDSYSIFIDYAHNALALDHILRTLREYHPGRLICLFGCGGNRARDRRYSMGETSGRLADLSIVTSDNPRYEDPDSIIEDILVGMRKSGGKYIRITDRREAIAYTLSIALPGDIILLSGKGHETYQEIQGKKYPMDERYIVYEQRKIQDEGLLCQYHSRYLT